MLQLVIYVPAEPSKTTSATFGLSRLVVGLNVKFELPNEDCLSSKSFLTNVCYFFSLAEISVIALSGVVRRKQKKVFVPIDMTD